MVAAYKAVGSLQVKTEADLKYEIGPAKTIAHQATVLKYLREPARVSMVIKDPLSGTEKFFADGRTVVHYTGISNTFIRRSVPPHLTDIVRRIDKDSPQLMSPLVFLVSNGIPVGIASARIRGREVINGENTLVIDGKYSDTFMNEFARRQFVQTPSVAARDFTLWLHEGNYLLAKSSVKLSWLGVVTVKGSNSLVKNPSVESVESTVELVQNPRFSTEEFRFIQPAGILEIPVERSEQIQ